MLACEHPAANMLEEAVQSMIARIDQTIAACREAMEAAVQSCRDAIASAAKGKAQLGGRHVAMFVTELAHQLH